MSPMATTIQITAATRERLAALKGSPRETYDELLNRLIGLIPVGDEEGAYSEEFRVSLLNARLDARMGRVVDHAAVKRRLGL